MANLISGHSNPFGFVVNPAGIATAMNFWDAVCPLIAQLQQMLGSVRLRVVADAYFSKAPFINWMLSLHVHVITRMRIDAVGWDDPQPEPPVASEKKKRGRKPTEPRKGKKWKIAQLLNLFPLQEITVVIYGKTHTLQIVTRDLWIKDVLSQKVRVVVIKTQKDPIILLSTDLTLSPVQIIQIYALRFTLELGIRDLKQHFGFTDYQSTSFQAMTRFIGLSLVSFCLWRLTILTDMNSDWLQVQEQNSLLSFTKTSRALRRFVMQKVFRNFASSANFQNSTATPEEIIHLMT
ncbi:MAG: transposase [bacterium]